MGARWLLSRSHIRTTRQIRRTSAEGKFVYSPGIQVELPALYSATPPQQFRIAINSEG
jgi:hypothetical protein